VIEGSAAAPVCGPVGLYSPVLTSRSDPGQRSWGRTLSPVSVVSELLP
jgi:hypothetical protein